MRKGARQGGRDQSAATAPPASGARLEQSEAEVSSARARVLEEIPSVWLEQLLVVVLDLPVERGERAVVESMLDSLAATLPSYAVGARLTSERTAERDPIVVCRTPVGLRQRPAASDPARMFPGLRHEHVVLVPRLDGSTLHLGSDDPDLDASGSPAARLIERAAMALGRVVSASRSAAVQAWSQRGAAFDQRMIRADKLATFGQVAAGVVHELNNPLTSIVAYSDYLVRKVDSSRDPDDVDRLRRISEAANRMLRFTRELVSYARPSAGTPALVALGAVIDRAIAFCEHVLAAVGMRVEREYAPGPLTVNAVSEQLVQVFVNLITNASQAAPPSGGRLLVRTSLRPSQGGGPRVVEVCVEDNGSGIADEHLPQIFVPFFTTKAESNGTGLGLSIVKSIVQSHEGDIRVESRCGVGTRFVVELPVSS